MELDLIRIGARIAKRREAAGLTQIELAERIDISNNHLSSIERGKAMPSLPILIKICDMLKITPDYLFLGTMHTDELPVSLLDSLRLCDAGDLPTLSKIIEVFVEKNAEKWNSDNSF